MRREPSRPEAMLWVHLRNRGILGQRFTRQRPCLGYILDFYCAALCLAVEVDGPQHHTAEGLAYDRRRDRAIKAAGIETLRIPAAMVLRDGGHRAAGVVKAAVYRRMRRRNFV